MDDLMKQYQALVKRVKEIDGLARAVFADYESAMNDLTTFMTSNPEFSECLQMRLESASTLVN